MGFISIQAACEIKVKQHKRCPEQFEGCQQANLQEFSNICSLQCQMKAHYSSSSADKFPTPLLTIKILDVIWIFRNTHLCSLFRDNSSFEYTTAKKNCFYRVLRVCFGTTYNSLLESLVFLADTLFSLLHKHPESALQFNGLPTYFSYAASHVSQKNICHTSPAEMPLLPAFFSLPPCQNCLLHSHRLKAYLLLTSIDESIHQQSPVHHNFGTSLETQQYTRMLGEVKAPQYRRHQAAQ